MLDVLDSLPNTSDIWSHHHEGRSLVVTTADVDGQLERRAQRSQTLARSLTPLSDPPHSIPGKAWGDVRPTQEKGVGAQGGVMHGAIKIGKQTGTASAWGASNEFAGSPNNANAADGSSKHISAVLGQMDTLARRGSDGFAISPSKTMRRESAEDHDGASITGWSKDAGATSPSKVLPSPTRRGGAATPQLLASPSKDKAPSRGLLARPATSHGLPSVSGARGLGVGKR